MEAYLPKFFRGALKAYRMLKVKPRPKANIPEAIKEIFLKNPLMNLDLEVFHFISQRFFAQLNQLSKRTN